ncbi:MAG: cysteine synthase A [Ruminococcaceae bacterium]|nr:cysteine synthase A [Oscillospiraceae bacterium]
MKIYKDITEVIGSTPLVNLQNFTKDKGVKAELLAKLEYFNPAGSVKDRAALYMIKDAEEKGILREGSLIIEPTSGNTGIGLAAVAASRGYKVILTMPDTMSVERRNLLKAYGAEIVLTDGSMGMSGAIKKAREIYEENEGSFMPSQFENEANAKAHFETTGPEIWQDTEGAVDVFVAGVGTGGTLTGVAKYLKSKNLNVKIIAVEPKKSPLLSGGEAGSHGLQGIGANFIPDILDTEIIDEVFPVWEKDAFAVCRELSRTEGYLVGISSGAALFAAMELAKREENGGKRVVALLPDTGERYLSTGIFD